MEKVKKTAAVKEEEIDEFDALVEDGNKGPKGSPDAAAKVKKVKKEPGAEPKKREPKKKKNDDGAGGDGLKQSKLNFGKTKVS